MASIAICEGGLGGAEGDKSASERSLDARARGA